MKIHCIEGLFSYHAGFLTNAVKSLDLDVEIIKYPWTVGHIDLGAGDMLFSHSFGGATAIKIWNKTPHTKAKALVTIDPRKPPLGFPDPKFAVGKGINQKVINYYQKGFVRGYEVSGAENILIKDVSHIRMPRTPQFLFTVINMVKEGK